MPDPLGVGSIRPDPVHAPLELEVAVATGALISTLLGVSKQNASREKVSVTPSAEDLPKMLWPLTETVLYVTTAPPRPVNLLHQAYLDLCARASSHQLYEYSLVGDSLRRYTAGCCGCAPGFCECDRARYSDLRPVSRSQLSLVGCLAGTREGCSGGRCKARRRGRSADKRVADAALCSSGRRSCFYRGN